MEARKIEEIEFHNRLRDPNLQLDAALYDQLTANKKYYSVARSSAAYFEHCLRTQCHKKDVLDYGCGNGHYAFMIAEHGGNVVGVDLSDVSIENCRRRASQEGSSATFRVADCENLPFDANSFDVVTEAGVLHHLDRDRAFAELARVTRPDGKVFCYEAVGHNPLFQAYRRLTPHLRTQFETEHILTLHDLQAAEQYFGRIETKFFHLAVLLAVPLRQTRIFEPSLRFLEMVDRVITSTATVGKYAWMMVFVLSQPRKNGTS